VKRESRYLQYINDQLINFLAIFDIYQQKKSIGVNLVLAVIPDYFGLAVNVFYPP